jgi:hypothetical protein
VFGSPEAKITPLPFGRLKIKDQNKPFCTLFILKYSDYHGRIKKENCRGCRKS